MRTNIYKDQTDIHSDHVYFISIFFFILVWQRNISESTRNGYKLAQHRNWVLVFWAIY